MFVSQKEATPLERFVNFGNKAFQVAPNSEIYVNKIVLLTYTSKVMDTTAKFIYNSHPASLKDIHYHRYAHFIFIVEKTATPKKYFHFWKSVRHLICFFKNTIKNTPFQ